MTLYDELTARGLLAQVTDEDEVKDLINNGKATFYIGFDCTADSLYRIEKSEKNGRTYTTVTELDRAGRRREIARLTGGDNITETTTASAEEQLAAADAWKQKQH